MILNNKNVIDTLEGILKTKKIKFNQRSYSDDYGANYQAFLLFFIKFSANSITWCIS